MASIRFYNSIKFEDDTYIMRVRPSFPEVLINGGYKKAYIVDCLSCNILKVIEFPDVTEDFAPHVWLTSPDGNRSYLLTNDFLSLNQPDIIEKSYAIELNHISGNSRKIQIPPKFHTHGEFCWFAPQLHIINREKEVLTLQNDSFLSFNSDLPEIKTGQLISEKLGSLSNYDVLKMDMENSGLYLFGGRPLRIGYASTDGQVINTVNCDSKAIDVAQYHDVLLVCEEDRVLLNKKNQIIAVLEADSHEFFMAINIISHNHFNYLNILSSAKDNSASWLKVYVFI